MNPLSRKTMILGAGLLIALSTGLSSCQDRDFGLTIRQVQPIDEETCELVLDENLYQGSGRVDIALRNSYRILARVQNNLVGINEVKGFDVIDSRVDTNDIVLRSATIEYTTLSALSAELNSIKVPLSVTVSAAGQVTVFVEVLNLEAIELLRSASEFLRIVDDGAQPTDSTIDLIARVRIEGETLDGRIVESNEFLYPITICAGCDVIFYYDRNGNEICPALPTEEGGIPFSGTPCNDLVGADGGGVDCRACPRFVPDESPYRQVCQPRD